jgi:hypothetical protein
MSVKISDLTAATELANNDLLAIVDVSDTTMAASGTTKKVELFNIIPRTFITQFQEDSLGNITQTTFYNTTGSSGEIYWADGYYEIMFNGEFNVHIANTTFFVTFNSIVPIWKPLTPAEIVGGFSISFYVFEGNTYVFWYVLDSTYNDSVRLFDVVGSENYYQLPEIKLFPTS